MTIDRHIELFVQQAAWLEAENAREMNRPRPRRKRFVEIRVRNGQLSREFAKFMEAHQL